MGSAFLDLVEGVAERVAAKTIDEGEGLDLLKRIVHGPAVAFIVKATPNPVDDLVLDLLQAVIPPPAK